MNNPPKTKICGKCGGPLGFRLIIQGSGKGKWCPCNPDGSDHCDDCRTAQTQGTYGILKVFNDHDEPKKTKRKDKKVPLYCGEAPPW